MWVILHADVPDRQFNASAKHCLSKHRGAKGHGTYNIPNRLACHQYRGAVAGVLFIVARTLTYLFSVIHRPIELVSLYSSSSSCLALAVYRRKWLAAGIVFPVAAAVFWNL